MGSFSNFSGWNGKEFEERGFARIRIPIEYRKIEKYKEIDHELYHFHDIPSLITEILNRYPGKFQRLKKLIDISDQ